MTPTKVKTSKTKSTQPGPYEGWTIEEIVAEMALLVGDIVDVIARKAAS